MSSILTNTSAMVALQTLKSVNSNLQQTQSQISTGKSVATAKDNSAIFAISKIMESDVAGFNAISESLALGDATVSVASNATEQIGGLLDEIKQKIVAANEDNVERSVLQDEIGRLRDQITSIVGAAQFNGKNMLQSTSTTSILASLDRSASGSVTTNNIEVSGRDFGTASGTAGTDAGKKNMSLGGNTVTGSQSTVTFASAAAYLPATVGAIPESITLNIDGVEVTASQADLVAEGIVTAGAAATDEQVADYLARAINGTLQDSSKNLGIQGLTAEVRPNSGTPANAEILLTSTASEEITVATSVAGTAAPAAPTLAGGPMAQVNGAINTAGAVTVDLGATAASTAAAGQSVSVTVGEDTFTFDASAGFAAGTALRNATVDGLNAALEEEGVTKFAFVAGTGASEITLQNLDTTMSYDVVLDTSTLNTNPDTGSVSAPTVAAATAESVDLTINGNVSEGDSFSVTVGDTTATFVASANQTAGDVARGLQNVLAAEGATGVNTAISFDGTTGAATISLSGDVGATVSISEASGGTETTGDLYGLSKLDVTTADGAANALGTIENLIQTNIDAQAEFGAAARRVELQSDFMSSLIDSFKVGIGGLVDADLEAASARLQALQVQQQLATQSLSIANQAPQNILALFR